MLSAQQEELLEKLADGRLPLTDKEQALVQLFTEQSQQFKAALDNAKRGKRLLSTGSLKQNGMDSAFMDAESNQEYLPSKGKPRQAKKITFSVTRPKVPDIVVDELAVPQLDASALEPAKEQGESQKEERQKPTITQTNIAQQEQGNIQLPVRNGSITHEIDQATCMFNQSVMQNIKQMYTQHPYDDIYSRLAEQQRRANELLEKQLMQKDEERRQQALRDKQFQEQQRRQMRLQLIQQREELDALRTEKKRLAQESVTTAQSIYAQNASRLTDGYYDYLRMRVDNQRRFEILEKLDDQFGDDRSALD